MLWHHIEVELLCCWESLSLLSCCWSKSLSRSASSISSSGSKASSVYVLTRTNYVTFSLHSKDLGVSQCFRKSWTKEYRNDPISPLSLQTFVSRARNPAVNLATNLAAKPHRSLMPMFWHRPRSLQGPWAGLQESSRDLTDNQGI